MKTLSIGAFLLSVLSSNAFAGNIYVEDGARLSEDISKELAIEFAKLIQLNGYSCESVSGVSPHVMSVGVTVYCNQWNYNYDIEDKGGNWIVTVN